MILDTTYIDSLLEPISEKSPVGEDVKYENIYDEIKEARREDDPSLSQGVWQIDLKKADWHQVIKLSENVLKTKSKHLQIVMWLTEAMTMLDGFDGLSGGLQITSAMCEKFWDDIYPSIVDTDDKQLMFAQRVSTLYFLSDKIHERVLLIPITSDNTMERSYNLSDWMTARYNMRIKKTDGITFQDLHKSGILTDLDFLKKIDSNLNDIFNSLNALDKFLVEKCGNQSPSFKILRDHLLDIQKINSTNLQNKIAELKSEEESRVEKQNVIDEQNAAQEAEENAHSSENADEDSSEKPTNFAESSSNARNSKQAVQNAYDMLNDISQCLELESAQGPSAMLIKIANDIGQKTFSELLDSDSQNGTVIIHTILELYKSFYLQKK